MAQLHIAIIGLGAIGSSIGLALRQPNERKEGAPSEYHLVGHDKNPEASRQAHKAGVVQKTEWNLISACEGADVIILALPLMAIRDTLKAIAPYLRADCVITDTATVKSVVLQWANEILPETVHFVGGNPIVATAASGIAGARVDLFEGANWCLTTTARSAPAAIERLTGIITRIGAKPYFVDAVEHDGLLAATDHLPLALAATLLRQVAASPSFREMSKVGGRTLAQVTFPAAAEAEAARDVCLLNRENIVRWLDLMDQAIRETRLLIASGDEKKIDAFFEGAREAWSKWARGEVEDAPPVDMSNLSSIGSMFFGRLPRLDRPNKK
jgi:prephenate dehydrogenase